jgi:4'-phosphopantetheinyl transferase
MDVYWLQQSEADLPATDEWLSESESARLSSFRFARRRADWRLGRWTAKCAVAASLRLPGDYRSLKQIEIIPAATGQPEVVLHDQAETVTISISHRGGVALCAVALGEVELGCDLEMIEPRSDAFTADYFTQKEQELIAQTSGEDKALLVSLLWSAKESALKALHLGLRADTRSVEVRPVDLHGKWFGELNGRSVPESPFSESPKVFAALWRPLQVQSLGGLEFCGRWQHSNDLVRTIVATVPRDVPRNSGGISVIELPVPAGGQEAPYLAGFGPQVPQPAVVGAERAREPKQRYRRRRLKADSC